MNLHELSILRAIVEQRGFAKAAKVAHVSQSAISQALKRLEDEVGAPLIERGRPPRLTAIGQRIYEHAVDAAHREQMVRRQVDELKRGHPGTIVLAASQALSRELLPTLIERFITQQPQVGLQLETLPSRLVISAVADGRVELGLGPFARAMAGLQTKVLGKQRMHLYAAKKITELERETLVTSHLEVSTGKRGSLREHFRRVWIVHSLDLRLRLVRDGLAVGYLPEASVRASKLKLIPQTNLPFGTIDRHFGLMFAAKRALSPAAQMFVEMTGH
jgi:DNA-binding transcriptional LysR family regulator